MVQWLGLCVSTAEGMVRSLVGELRSHMQYSAARGKKKKKKKHLTFRGAKIRITSEFSSAETIKQEENEVKYLKY